MRTIDMTGFNVTCPESIKQDITTKSYWAEYIKYVQGTYATLLADGVPPEDARSVLPTNVQTNIIAKFNLRTLVDMVGKRQNPRAQQEYQDVVRDMVKEVQTVHGWVDLFFFPERTRTPALDQVMRICRQLNCSKHQVSPFSKNEILDAQKEIDKLKGVWG
jgi:thymidylate synthase ThyX